jgi:hypothetical protein
MAKAGGFSDDVLDVLRSVAPTLAGAATMMIPGVGPALAPVMAGLAKQALGKTLGVVPTEAAINEKIESELKVIRSNGEGALLREADLNLSLKQAQDVEYQKLLLETDLGHHKLDNESTQAARDMNTSTRDWFPKLLDFMDSIVFYGIIACIIFVPLADLGPIRDLLIFLLGLLGAAYKDTRGYWRGTSDGARRLSTSMQRQMEARR